MAVNFFSRDLVAPNLHTISFGGYLYCVKISAFYVHLFRSYSQKSEILNSSARKTAESRDVPMSTIFETDKDNWP